MLLILVLLGVYVSVGDYCGRVSNEFIPSFLVLMLLGVGSRRRTALASLGTSALFLTARVLLLLLLLRHRLMLAMRVLPSVLAHCWGGGG